MSLDMTTRKKANSFLRNRLEVFSLGKMELANAYSLATIIITYDYTVNLLRFF